MKKIINRELNKLNKKENKLLNKRENKFIKNKVAPISDKIEEKIPQKLKDTLESAFYNGFKLVLEKGSKYIEKLYNKDKIQLEHDVNNYSLDKKVTRKSIKIMDSQGKKSKIINSTISTIEGAGLGVLGIGLPDIPLFIAMILKTVYEIALSYGFNYESEEEKIYILNLINVALTNSKEKVLYNEKLNEVEYKIDSNIVINRDLNLEIRSTSQVLSESLLMAKFIQGLPIVGVLGSITNYQVINKVSKYARIRYKKRYLNKKL
ncbi:EcsC family protein [Clostridium tertium]|uniref:EcsC family protein n=1 Tax=Clostridium TaxID=1485 RepID=UPI000DD017BE|nr:MULTISPECIES: EcsC family protein [Clostridium]MCR1950848.1 EcsC family protein [Clostridium sp. DSM 100503]MDB1924363.1 EcsC family protein [Clostridium tertium]MDB1927989.1 EcsC family protein [Clostridium tertium]MDB1931234.1 EcsC family protein [Clostridium tertium]